MCKDGTASGADASVFANDIPGPDVAAPRENIYDVVSKESWYKVRRNMFACPSHLRYVISLALECLFFVVCRLSMHDG